MIVDIYDVVVVDAVYACLLNKLVVDVIVLVLCVICCLMGVVLLF